MSYNLKDFDDSERSDTGFGQRRMHLVVSVVIIVLLAVACTVLSIFLAKKVHQTPQLSSEKVYCMTPECLELSADFARNMNTSLDPCEDFYQHACGSWKKNHPIPSSRNMNDVFYEIDEKNSHRLREMLEEVDKLPENSAVKKTKRYFKTCLNEKQVENTPMNGVKQLIAKYGSWALDNKTWNPERWQWSKVLSAMVRVWEQPPFVSPELSINPHNSSQHLLVVGNRFL